MEINYCHDHRKKENDIEELKRAYVQTSDSLNEMIGKMDELLHEMRKTRQEVAVWQNTVQNHIENFFIHLNKWYGSAILIGGIIATVLGVSIGKW